MTTELQEIKELLLEVRRGLRRAEDFEAIRNLITAYARGCDRGNDPVMLAPLFTPDATWECNGFGKYYGREKVAAALKGIAGEKIWWSLHYMISPQIELDSSAERAKLFWYLWESATIPDSDTNEAESHWIGGSYDAEAVREADGRWRFSMMALRLNIASPYGAGWVKQRFPRGNSHQPYFCELEADTYHWCACGRSKNQPFCDGSHRGTNIRPVEFTLDKRELVVLCGCKRTGSKPMCDGTHLNLNLETNGR
ncbi:MAG: nuclear transport factor 2 family protein [Candidatus Binataceae bacterium]